jgi:hypothetical protein
MIAARATTFTSLARRARVTTSLGRRNVSPSARVALLPLPFGH